MTEPTAKLDWRGTGRRAGARYALMLPRTVRLGQRGERTGAREGSSMEFLDHRDYQPGDDPRRVDWGAYARSDRLVIRRYHDEASPHLDVLLDTSGSMGLEGSAKPDAARALAACLATCAQNAGFTHRVHLLGDHGRELAGGAGHVEGWEEISFGGQTSCEESFRVRPAKLRTRATRVLVSDLLWPGEPSALMTRVAGEAGMAVVIQLLAEQDVTPPELGMYRLVDSETGLTRDVTIDVPAQQAYLDRLSRHTEAWRMECRRVGAAFVQIKAESFLASGSLDELVKQEVVSFHS